MLRRLVVFVVLERLQSRSPETRRAVGVAKRTTSSFGIAEPTDRRALRTQLLEQRHRLEEVEDLRLVEQRAESSFGSMRHRSGFHPARAGHSWTGRLRCRERAASTEKLLIDA